MNECRVCRTPTEGEACEKCMKAARERFRAGDFVSSVTKAFGFRECGGCGQRRKAMNNVDFSKPAKEVFEGLAKAIFEPEKELDEDSAKEDTGRKEG